MRHSHAQEPSTTNNLQKTTTGRTRHLAQLDRTDSIEERDRQTEEDRTEHTK